MTQVLILTGDGCSPDLDYAVFRMREEGLAPVIAAPAKKALYAVFHQQEDGWDNGIERAWYSISADAAFDDVDPTQFDGLLIPGGRAPVYLRNSARCIEWVRHFIDAKKSGRARYISGPVSSCIVATAVGAECLSCGENMRWL